ncbi:MAG: septation protein SepH [Nocardioides sp.]
MAHLTLVGLSKDATRLLLVDDRGTEYTLDIDAPLRAALRGDGGRLGQLEIDMDMALRPRDIQARIRAGETPEAVAKAAQTSVDKVMPFAAPVLAERAHVAERAQRSSVRRSSSEGGARTLGEAVAEHLRSLNVSPDTVTWDAWRREDGRWTLVAAFAAVGRSGTASYAYDARGSYVVPEDDDARWLVGDALPEPEPQQPSGRDDLGERRRRLAAVPEEALPLGEDALDLVSDEPDHVAAHVADHVADHAVDRVSTTDLSDTAAQVRRIGGAEPQDAELLGGEAPAEAFLDRVFARQNPQPAQADADPVDGASAVAAPDLEDPDDLPDISVLDEAHQPGEEHVGPPRRQVKKTRGRASVPSWDEIMFGGGSGSAD